MFVDGFNVVNELKKISPDAFHILTAFDVGYCDEGNDAFGEYSLGYSTPVVKYVWRIIHAMSLKQFFMLGRSVGSKVFFLQLFRRRFALVRTKLCKG